jgi:hypothetical protein
MLPPDAGSSGDWTPSKIATTLTLYKSILGPAASSIGGESQVSSGANDLISELKSKLAQLEKNGK